MTTVRLGTVLRDLVDGVEDDATPPLADDLWTGGSRRRLRSRAVTGLAAASVAAVVALAVWPGGQPRASVPADGTAVVDGVTRLTSYPANVALPMNAPTSDRPGRAALVLNDRDDRTLWYAVSPTGAVHRIHVRETDGQAVALSPDGRWLSAGSSLVDLVDGEPARGPGAACLPPRAVVGLGCLVVA